jgi:hypothetical protein
MVHQLTEQLIKSETTAATDYLQTVATSQMLAGIQITTEALFGISAQCILATA